MQYVLTQEEYDELKDVVKMVEEANKKMLQNLCTRVAQLEPVIGWDTRCDPQPWGCELGSDTEELCCDKCPVRTVCPCDDKEFSK